MTSISITDLAHITGCDADDLTKALDETTPTVPDPRPSAAIIPFPVRRRQRWIEAQRQRAATFPRREQEWLRSQVEKYQTRLTEIGVDPALVEREVNDLEEEFFGAGDQRVRA
jgi:hypothetical protein